MRKDSHDRLGFTKPKTFFSSVFAEHVHQIVFFQCQVVVGFWKVVANNDARVDDFGSFANGLFVVPAIVRHPLGKGKKLMRKRRREGEEKTETFLSQKKKKNLLAPSDL
jgi:hypothetical protein